MRYIEKDRRPWGTYYVIEDKHNHKIKRIEVEVGQRLSYQYHNKRSEVWTIIEGVALITLDGIEKKFHKGETIIIPLGIKHRVKNIGKVKLIFIEVQTGEYFGEDDIVRIEDDYKRIK
jgi:mannose-6-phosphate isomerase